MTAELAAPLEQALRELRLVAPALPSGRRSLLTFRSAPARTLALLEGPRGARTRVFWQTGRRPGEPSFVALGTAARFEAQGEMRLSNLKNQIQNWYSTFGNLGEKFAGLKVFGGASFGQPRDCRGPWATFGDASFVAPQVLVRSCGTEPDEWSIVVDRADLAATEATLDALLEEVRARGEGVAEGRRGDRSGESFMARLDPNWVSRVQAAQRQIADGQLAKVVLARKLSFELRNVPRLAELVEQLIQQGPAAARFALELEGRTFLGASPERLVRVEGPHLETEALAGTFPKGDQARARLLGNRKERFEHRLVVEAILGAIQPLCREIRAPESPEIVELPNLLHLRTPISAELREATHVLDLVQELHPTPAVGGAPREAALRFIAEVEPAERGWYAGPFGWVDGQGNGEFVVALRSALMEGSTAHLYAGAGIVAESDPILEFQETEIKLARMRSALGLRATTPDATAGTERWGAQEFGESV